jgi:hypothetical protein
LHSFAFVLVGATKEVMMNPRHYRDFGERCGIPIKVAAYSDDDGIFNSDNEYLKPLKKLRLEAFLSLNNMI